MKTDPTVQFFDDEDDTLYVEFEGKLETKFTDSETETYMSQLKGMDPEQRDKSLMALVLEMSFAFVHEIAPVLRQSLMEQYDIELDQESMDRIDEGVVEILPGFMKIMQDAEVEDGEE